MVGRAWGEHCEECGHDRGRHNLDGELGSCCRVGCECGGYLEEVHRHAETVQPGLEMVIAMSRRHRSHGGWRDR